MTGDPPNWNNNWFTQQGWQCPNCGRIYSPNTMECLHCNYMEIKTTTSTDVKNDEEE